jgi:hypothetical protein
MKTIITSISLIILICAAVFTSNSTQVNAAGRAGCEAYIYIANNSLFDCPLTVDGIGVGTLRIGKSKIYTVELLNDTPRKIKVKVEWLDPDYIEPKSYYLLTKSKIECGQTDSMYIAHTK